MKLFTACFIVPFLVCCTNSNKKEKKFPERKKYSPDFFVQLSGKKYTSCKTQNFNFKKTRVYIFNRENQGETRPLLDSLLNSYHLLAKDSADYETVAIVYNGVFYNALYDERIGETDSKILFLSTKTWCCQWDTTLKSTNWMDYNNYYNKIMNALITKRALN